jgi:hypothetical protein
MVSLAWVIILMCIAFFGGMIIGYVAFNPKFEEMIDKQTTIIHTRRSNLISSWQLNLARRIAQIMIKPGTYNFQIELDENGRKVFRFLKW